MKTQIREVLPFLAIVAASVALGVRAARYEHKKAKERAEKTEFLKHPATLIEKSEPYKYGCYVARDLYFDMNGKLSTAEAVARVFDLTSNPTLNCAVRDLTNGTVKTVAEWQKFGHFQTIHQR